jgi:hypothetical protein
MMASMGRDRMFSSCDFREMIGGCDLIEDLIEDFWEMDFCSLCEA